MAANPQKISFEDARILMDHEPAHLILDVREESEYITGHAAGADLFPVSTINAETAAANIPAKSMPVFVYCRSGTRSAKAAAALAAMGYERVYDMGSLVGWPYGLAY